MLQPSLIAEAIRGLTAGLEPHLLHDLCPLLEARYIPLQPRIGGLVLVQLRRQHLCRLQKQIAFLGIFVKLGLAVA